MTTEADDSVVLPRGDVRFAASVVLVEFGLSLPGPSRRSLDLEMAGWR